MPIVSRVVGAFGLVRILGAIDNKMSACGIGLA